MTNQVPRHAGFDAYTTDGVMLTLTKDMPDSLRQGFSAHGKWVGAPETLDLARMANENPPQLRALDANGDRYDRVEFHPAYHALMRKSVSLGLTGSIWETNEEEQGIRNQARAVRFMLTSQLEQGHTCPITMTHASVAALMQDEALLKDWMPRIISREYDSSQRSPGAKKGVTVGMGLTERQGGSDVRANTTRAEAGRDGRWRINGEKWFFSAPMCDAFLVLAQSKGGLSCFLMPRLLPDGSNNGLQFQRLKEKTGNNSNASSEVKFVDAIASLVGEEGQGLRVILEMVTLSRLDVSIGSAGQMRAALAEAVHHCRRREAFGKKLIDQPLMARVLADLALDVAAAQSLAMRIARSFDYAASNDVEGGYARMMTPAVKYWICKAAPAVIVEAMECIGGNGYVEDSVMPRLYREAPLNGIWEGSGNIMCLDVLRAMRKSPTMAQNVFESLAQDMGGNASQTIDVLRIAGDIALQDEGSARIFTEQLALTAAAAELRRTMPDEIADAFIESRLGRPWRTSYGMMDARYDARAILDFICP